MPAEADFVCYWFVKAGEQIEAGVGTGALTLVLAQSSPARIVAVNTIHHSSTL